MNEIRNLASILIRPRETMRRILDQPRDRMVFLLAFLGGISGALADRKTGNLPAALEATPWAVPIMIFVTLAVALLMALVFYGLSWVAMLAGRAFEGQGTIREARSALAWGLAPAVWALLYRVPLALLFPRATTDAVRVSDASVRISGFDFSSMGVGCVVALLDLAVLIWYLIIGSAAMGEAHRFSNGRGFAVLLMTWAAPVIVLIAAVISLATRH
jgi:hypothetical protein